MFGRILLAALVLAASASAALAHRSAEAPRAEIPWPKGFVTPAYAQDRLFRDMQDYVRELSNDRVRVVPDADTIELREGYFVPDRGFLRLHVDREASPTKVVESITISLGGRFSGVVTITRTGKDLKPTPSAELLRFKLPDPAASDSYELLMPNFPPRIRFDRRKDGELQGVFEGSFFALHYVARDNEVDGGAYRLWRMLYPGYPPYGVEIRSRPVMPGLWEFIFSYEGYFGRPTAAEALKTISGEDPGSFMWYLGVDGSAVVSRGKNNFGWPPTRAESTPKQ